MNSLVYIEQIGSNKTLYNWDKQFCVSKAYERIQDSRVVTFNSNHFVTHTVSRPIIWRSLLKIFHTYSKTFSVTFFNIRLCSQNDKFVQSGIVDLSKMNHITSEFNRKSVSLVRKSLLSLIKFANNSTILENLRDFWRNSANFGRIFVNFYKLNSPL